VAALFAAVIYLKGLHIFEFPS